MANLCNSCFAKQIQPKLAKHGYSMPAIENRFGELLANPDDLEQWAGVCGFAANIHEIFKRPIQIRDLFEATFHDLQPKSYDPYFRMADNRMVQIPFVELIGDTKTAQKALKDNKLVLHLSNSHAWGVRFV